jgi:heme exporter protein A
VGGQNGTGKTSLLRVICGFLEPEAGEVTWNQIAVRALGDEYNSDLAYVGHLNAVKDDLSALENLRFAAQLAGLRSIRSELSNALQKMGIAGSRHVPGKFLSQGQKRRLALARLCLCGHMPLWVLDEPFAALDAAGIEAVRTLLEQHFANGGMAVVTTHQDVPLAARSIERLELRATGAP